MKITVYTLVTDTDDGLQSHLYATEAARDAASFAWLAECDDKGRTVDQIKTEYGDPITAGEAISNGEDYFNIDDVPMEIADAKSTQHLLMVQQGGDMDVTAFASYDEAEAAAWQTIQNIFTEDGGTDGYEEDEFDTWRESCTDVHDAWEQIQAGSNNSLHIEEVVMDLPSVQNAELIENLRGALGACVDQINQMSGSFDDADGTIQAALDAAAQAEAAALASPACSRPRVGVEVVGGVADVTQCPDGVDVEIIDHDNERNG